MYVYMYKYIRIWETRVQVCTHVYKCMRTYVYVFARVYICMGAYARMYACIYVRKCASMPRVHI